MRSPASFQALKERVYIILNIGCLDWNYMESNMLVYRKADAPRSEAVSVCLEYKQMPTLQPGAECFVTGGCFGSCWRCVTTKTI